MNKKRIQTLIVVIVAFFELCFMGKIILAWRLAKENRPKDKK